MSTSYSPSLVLTWTDHRPRPVWCAVCLLLLVALAEVAWRGYGLWALLGLLLWIPLAWFGWPAPPGAQELLLAPHGSQLWQEDGAEPVAIELLSGVPLPAAAGATCGCGSMISAKTTFALCGAGGWCLAGKLDAEA